MSSPFNPDVANAFFRAGEIEAWGRGIQRILDACRTGDAPEPEIRLEPNGLWLDQHKGTLPHRQRASHPVA